MRKLLSRVADSPLRFYLWPHTRLALGVLLIYWPIRLYQNVPVWSGAVLLRKLPFFLVEGLLIFGLLLGWVLLMDGLQDRLGGTAASLRRRLPPLVLTLLLAVGLAIPVNELFGRIHARMQQGLEHELPTRGPAPDEPADDNRQRRRMNNGLTVLALLAAFYLTANRRSARLIQQLGRHAERLELATVQAQLEALRNQVNPHFLFNSLSILAALVDTDARLAGQFVARLATTYRYLLEQHDQARVLLRTELDFLAAYTFLLTLRFEGKLFVDLDVPEAARNGYAIAPLTLQLLLENAVKHNRLSAAEPLRVTIALAGDCLRVANPVQRRLVPEASTGVGLQNIMGRYRLLTDQSVRVTETDGYFIVDLPLLPLP
ncbi:histidine kinase [Hymenobacter aquaticus]|uniref:Histidine kinase n=1 Tax=Hymenobacter aquaticus TaxID=1867101 RepID=A0A4Z0PVU1_9BACT|nr:histidine kinase [Hymenobacter aquaticus]